MSTPSGSASRNGKFCTVCNDDVSDKPRTKDARGRYFCTACYENAIRAKQQRRESTPLPKVHQTPAKPKRPVADAGEPNVLEQLLDLEPVAAAPPMICPSCRSQIAAGSVICTMCGHNLQTGAAVGSTQVKHVGPSGAAWPLVVGITSIVFGAGGAIVAALSLLGNLASSSGNSSGAYSAGRLAGGIVPVVLALWLLSSGIGIVRRNSGAVSQIKRWAVVKLVLYCTCISLMLATMPANPTGNPNGLPAAFGSLKGNMTAILVGALVWVSIWPVFVLIWFSRASVKRDVEQWG